ncbi:MAG: histidine--tRNA ligase, partial [candidate division Zixibacteria bacterium]|nr:histidine--tRNA ligase [candidate division Zixibacteria bacterium]
PYADVEGILLNLRILESLGIDGCQLKINSIGDPDCRARYREALKEYLKPKLDKLCEDCRGRFQKNPMRILDCKKGSCQAELEDAPMILDHLGEESKKHFEQVCSSLDKLNVSYIIDKRLVRGLDYYTRTVFEIISKSLGAQDSLSGGGRYDLLVEQLGGKPTPAFGFAAGMERLILVMQESENLDLPIGGIDCYIATPKGENLDEALILAEKVRSRNLSVEIDLLCRSLKAELKTANKLNANFVVILGDNELKRGVGSVRNMQSSEQWEEPLDKLPTRLAELVSTRRG